MYKFGNSLEDKLCKYTDDEGITNGEYAPGNRCRVLISGFSGSGKTTLLLNYLLGDDDKRINFTRLYLVAKDLSEPCYRLLIDTCTQMETFINEQLAASDQAPDVKILTTYDSPESLDIDTMDVDERNLIVFDDCVLELENSKSRKPMQECFMRARKKNASMVFLTQNFFHDNLKFIRMQCDYIVLFNMGSGDTLRRCAQELSVDVHQLADACKKAWAVPYGWVMVDKRKNKISIGF